MIRYFYITTIPEIKTSGRIMGAGMNISMVPFKINEAENTITPINKRNIKIEGKGCKSVPQYLYRYNGLSKISNINNFYISRNLSELKAKKAKRILKEIESWNSKIDKAKAKHEDIISEIQKLVLENPQYFI